MGGRWCAGLSGPGAGLPRLRSRKQACVMSRVSHRSDAAGDAVEPRARTARGAGRSEAGQFRGVRGLRGSSRGWRGCARSGAQRRGRRRGPMRPRAGPGAHVQDPGRRRARRRLAVVARRNSRFPHGQPGPRSSMAPYPRMDTTRPGAPEDNSIRSESSLRLSPFWRCGSDPGVGTARRRCRDGA